MIRGEDHISNTPKHILLFEALGHPVPVFGHLPLILNPDGTKMSKRKSQTAVDDYRGQGFIREGARQLPRLPRLEPGHRGGRPLARRGRRAVRHRGGPEGRRPVRSGPARVAERPVDPAARAGRPRRPPPAVPRGRRRRRPDRPPAVRRRGPDARCRSSRSGCRPSPRSSTSSGSCGPTTSRLDPAILVPKRWDAATTREGLAAARDDPGRATTP